MLLHTEPAEFSEHDGAVLRNFIRPCYYFDKIGIPLHN